MWSTPPQKNSFFLPSLEIFLRLAILRALLFYKLFRSFFFAIKFMLQPNDLRPQAARVSHTPRSPHLLQTLSDETEVLTSLSDSGAFAAAVNAKAVNIQDGDTSELTAGEIDADENNLYEKSPRATSEKAAEKSDDSASTLCDLMRELIREQRHQTSLLEDLVDHTCRLQRRKEGELSRWRRGHPQLAAQCRRAASALSDIQTDYLHTIVQEVSTGLDTFPESELFLGEFVDRFGMRFAHLNSLVQTLAQLGNSDGRF